MLTTFHLETQRKYQACNIVWKPQAYLSLDQNYQNHVRNVYSFCCSGGQIVHRRVNPDHN